MTHVGSTWESVNTTGDGRAVSSPLAGYGIWTRNPGYNRLVEGTCVQGNLVHMSRGGDMYAGGLEHVCKEAWYTCAERLAYVCRRSGACVKGDFVQMCRRTGTSVQGGLVCKCRGMVHACRRLIHVSRYWLVHVCRENWYMFAMGFW